MGLRLKFNLVLATILLIGQIVGALVLYRFSEHDEIDHLHSQIEALRAYTLSVRRYTSEEIEPLLTDVSGIKFLPQAVPAHAAQEIFSNFREKFPNFTYREAALNPTNRDHLADAWEKQAINKLRSDRSLGYLARLRETPRGEEYAVAFPLSVNSESCLGCHSSPDRAPKSMVNRYGDKNGFGWEMGEIVGVQIITSLVNPNKEQGWNIPVKFVATALLVFFITMLLLNVLIGWMVVSPVKKMARIAHAVSMGDNAQPEFVLRGSDEIASLSQSFSRMRRSLDNAMKMLETPR